MKRFLAFSMLLPMLILAGCKDPDESASDIEVIISASPTSIPLDNGMHIEEVKLDTKFQSGTTALSGKWELTSSKTWVTFSTKSDGSGATATLSGLGPTSVYFVIPENTEESRRSADVFVNGATTPLVSITQDGTGVITISVSPTSITDMVGDAQAPCSQTITVNCVNEGGTAVGVGDWTLASSETWLTLTLNSDGSGAAATISGTGTKTVYLVVSENGGSSVRTANITLDGGSTPAVTVTQEVKIVLPALPEPAANALDGIDGAGELPTDAASYVGAFWRAGQTGERVIATNAGTNTGDWTATVAWYDSKWNPAAGDGVVLAAGDSADPNIRHASNEPGDAESYKVSGTSASVTGTVAAANDKIVFRIGLTKAFTAYNAATNPARYAVVKLSYAGNTKHQLIFLRQGEGADYVMRPGDKDGSNNNVGDSDRSYARKFAVYNLTASDAEWTAKPGGTKIEDFPQLAVNGGTFVQYPTQGGGTFQGQAKEAVAQRRVYSHTYTTVPTDWPTPYSGPELWSPSTDETCPHGYRRPQDGNPASHGTSGSAPTKGSEIRQSLWLNQLTGVGTNVYDLTNSAWGYYADGFFDRRQIVNGLGASAGNASTVAAATRNAAYLGRIMFNPTTKASLFLPAAGYRTTGDFSYAGNRAYYWMGSSFTATNLAAFYISNIRASPYSQNRVNGWSIRCIQEP